MTAPRRHVVTLAVSVRLAQQVVAWDPEQARVPLERLSHDLQDAVQELRVLAHGVYLLVLMDRGLVAAFESAAGRASLRVLVVGGRRGAVLPGGMGWGLLLLPGGVPETRPSTPARARGVAVTIERRAERLSFTVADNGRRVRPDGSSGGCHGCVSISDRVGAIGRGARGRLGVPPGTRVSGVRIWGPHSVQHGFVERCEGKGMVRKFNSTQVRS